MLQKYLFIKCYPDRISKTLPMACVAKFHLTENRSTPLIFIQEKQFVEWEKQEGNKTGKE